MSRWARSRVWCAWTPLRTSRTVTRRTFDLCSLFLDCCYFQSPQSPIHPRLRLFVSSFALCFRHFFTRLMAKAATMPVVPPCAQVTPDTISAVIYTSGTTGNPKGVELSHRNIVSNVARTAELWRPSGMLEGQTTLAFLPWAHVFGMTCELHQFNAGGTCLFCISVFFWFVACCVRQCIFYLL